MKPMEVKTDYGKSVAGVVIREGKVLLVRHTYGSGNGMLIVPGGYLCQGESPENAVAREIMEETSVTVRTGKLLGIRFTRQEWYAIFEAVYISGTPVSDGCENSEAIWMPVEEALLRSDVPELTKECIRCGMENGGFEKRPYETSEKRAPYSLYTSLKG